MMHDQSLMPRFLARLVSFIRSPYAWVLVFPFLFLLPDTAHAAASCPAFVVPDSHTSPSTSPMASGGTITVDTNSCDPLQIGMNPLDTATPHGHASMDTLTDILTYVNGGDGATVDNFVIYDANNNAINVTVNIAAKTSPITVSPGTLPTPAIGVAYSQQLSSTGGVGSYTYSVTPGSLPPGLTLSSSGLISGVPTGAGSYGFAVSIQDSTTPTALTTTKSYNVTIAGPTFTPSASSLTAGTVGVAYSATLGTTGGTAPYTYTNLSGLPAGWSLSTAGVLTGTPTVTTTYTITYNVQDSTTIATGGSYTQAQTVTLAVNALPAVTSMSPTSGPAAGGTSVTIMGTGFTGATAVAFGGTAATGYTVISATQITATAPAGSGTVDVRVTTPSGTSPATASDQFTYIAAPVVTSLSPITGLLGGGTSVTISGTGFTGSTAVTFGGAAATTYTVNSATQITAIAPAGMGAGTVDVRVTSPGGTSAISATDRFTYVPMPTVVIVSPDTGLTTGGTSVTISGTGFTGTTGVSFGGANATSVTIVNDTIITATTPAGSAGAVNVVVTTPGGSGTLTNGYTYVVAAPTISSISPTSGPVAGNTTVTISGSNFTGASSVKFGPTNATSFTVSNANSISAVSPSGSAGVVDITVTTGGGTSLTTAGDQFTYKAPLSLTPVTLTGATFGAAYSQQLSATGGSGPYTFTVDAGLPTGLSLSAGGVISGTPTVSGTFTFTVTATDSLGLTGSRTYTSFAVTAIAPSAPTGVSATAGSGQATVTFSAPANDGGSPILSYKATSSPGNVTATLNGATASPIVVTGLANGTAYTFTVTATNAIGGGSPSAPSSSVTPLGTQVIAFANPGTQNYGTAPTLAATGGASGELVQFTSETTTVCTITSGGALTFVTAGTCTIDANQAGNSNYKPAPQVQQTFSVAAIVPGAPVMGAATVGNTQATVTFTSPTNTGGTPITGYTVTSSPAGITATGNASPITITNLLNGTAYTFTVTANNGAGTGSASAASNSVTPVAPQTISFSNPGSQSFGTSQPLHATATSGLSVTFTSTSPSVCTITPSGTLSAVAPGTCTINADQVGDASFLPAPRVTQVFSVVVPGGAVSIGTTSLAIATAGTAYSQTIDANGGAVPYSFIEMGALPAGLTFTNGGVLSGTPTVSGSFPIMVTVTDLASQTAQKTFILTVNAPAVTVTPATLPAVQAETAYSQQFSANGGTTPYTYAVTTGSLPAGMTLSSTGLLSGTPTVSGDFNITVTATDKFNFAGAQSYTLKVTAPAIAVTPATLTAGQVAVAYNQTLSASGGVGPYSFTVSPGTLPAGMTLSSAGVLSGTPTAAGSFNIPVTATDAHSFTGTQTYTLVVSTPTIVLTPTSLTAGQAAVVYSQQLNASGGVGTYTYAVSAGALPTGLTLDTNGLLSGTPKVAGSFNATVTATDSKGFTGNQAYTLVVSAPTIVLTPTSLPAGQVAAVYSQQLSASGGLGSYTYTVSAGALPAGLSLSANGLLAGTPTEAGSFNLTIAAKDTGGFIGTQAYTLTLNQPVPVVVNDTTSTAANAAVTIPVTTNDTGPITSITVAHAPIHGTATISGLNVVYTPATNYYGSDNFTYTATGPGGTSTPATVTITVTPLAVPVAQPLTATILAGKAVTLHGAQGATGGPFTALTVATPPSTGTLDITGTDMVYTPAADASGAVSFDYTLSNAFGISAPAHVTITVNPVPVAPALSANVLAGSSVQVDLTANAHGGPFTGATMVSVTPSNAGSTSIHATATGYALTFTAAATFSGNAQLSYTLTNAYATSAPGSIAISVTARPDPSKDAEVLGVLNAQVDSARRMAQGQISNFQQRLESLHNGGGAGGFSNGITLTSASQQNRDPMQALRSDSDGLDRRYLVQPGEPAATANGSPAMAGTGSLPGGISVWTGGALNFGKTQPGSSDNGIDFTTSGLSVGADKRINDAIALGVGVGYGHDASDIGQHGSRSTTDSYNVAFYASYRPYANVYVDSLLGYQWLSFDARRYVTGDGSFATGTRDGTQLFGSFALGYEHRTQDWLLSPYARLDLAHAQLDAYTEQGQATDTLSYQRQTVKTTTGNLGLRAEWTIKADYGTWMPTLRAEYEHDFQGSSLAAMRYADLLSGPLYQSSLAGQSSNRTLLGAGIRLQTIKGWMLRFEYQNTLESSTRENQSVLLGVEKKFNP
ncbi:putative Ig domain-containing protein [Dyella sp. 20L07]|uniref:putative Ig domain-containing protein n=1 Tax=Dyella sp. 20L07 TaxID=3384240 RepID=UPI003D2AC7F5